MRIRIKILLLLTIFAFAKLGAQPLNNGEPTTRILFIFDASKSMWGRWQTDAKITIARNILTNMLDSLEAYSNLQIGLRVFGHQKDFPPQDCDDTRLEVPISFNSIPKIKHRLKTIYPRGTTPIALSLEACANDFTECKNCRNVVILITDGIEECGGDPCAISIALQKKGIVLKPFVIGVGLDFKEAFDCVGTYFDGSTETKFQDALTTIISHVIHKTTAQVSLLDAHEKASETNVVYTLHDATSNSLYYQYVHTMNTRGLPDTLLLDPIPVYKAKVYTIPQVWSDSVSLAQGKHTIIPANTPQGKLVFKTKEQINRSKYSNLPVIIRLAGNPNTLNVQNFFREEIYLAQKFDAEILCLPRILLKDIEVKPNQTTYIEVSEPGTVEFLNADNGSGALFTLKNGNEIEWIYNFKPNSKNLRLMLQPGTYRSIFRANSSNTTTDTKVVDFQVEAGRIIKVNVLQDN